MLLFDQEDFCQSSNTCQFEANTQILKRLFLSLQIKKKKLKKISRNYLLPLLATALFNYTLAMLVIFVEGKIDDGLCLFEEWLER